MVTCETAYVTACSGILYKALTYCSIEEYVCTCTTLLRLLACKLKLHTSTWQTNTERYLRAHSTKACSDSHLIYISYVLSGILTLTKLLRCTCMYVQSVHTSNDNIILTTHYAEVLQRAAGIRLIYLPFME